MESLKVYCLMETVDLGYSLEGLYFNEDDAKAEEQRLRDEYIKRYGYDYNKDHFCIVEKYVG